jgi:hypothetical protein
MLNLRPTVCVLRSSSSDAPCLCEEEVDDVEDDLRGTAQGPLSDSRLDLVVEAREGDLEASRYLLELVVDGLGGRRCSCDSIRLTSLFDAPVDSRLPNLSGIKDLFLCLDT